jgi:DNA-directed RNA polymerase subunit RPC12/RpoP
MSATATESAGEGRSLQLSCPRCAAPLRWDPDADALTCGHCEQRVEVPRGEAVIYEYPYEARAQAREGFDLPVRHTRCTRCGAEVSFDQNALAKECCFCGSPQVLEEASLRRTLRPESVIPLDVGRGTVELKFRQWVGSRWFAPRALSKTREFRAVGVYVPFWTFDARADSQWTAEAGHYYYVPVTRTVMINGKLTTRVHMEQRVRWEPAAGARQDAYDDWLIHASRGLSVELSAKLGRYDLSKLVPYKPDYLAGWSAEEYAIGLDDACQNFLAGVRAEQRRRCSGDVPGDTQRNLQVRTHIHEVYFKHVLLPVWSLTYQWRGQSYAVLIHGQTGHVVGKAPVSWVKVLLLVVLVLLGIGLVALLASRS